MASWKRDFASGLIVLVPLIVTVIVLAWLYSHLTRVPIPIGPLAEAYGLPAEPVRVALTIVIFILLVFSVGYLMRTAVGAVVETAIDDLMNSLPGLRVIYNASKMAVETALGGTSELQAPVRLEVWDGLRMTAFKTGKRTSDGREVLFLPTAPNITTGFVLEVEPDRYYEIDDSVEDALTRLLSAGFGESSEEAVSEMFGTPHDGGERPAEVSIDDVTGDGIEGAPLAETETGTGGGQESSVESAGGTPPDEDR
jgi:uncharacterized membrane protein